MDREKLLKDTLAGAGIEADDVQIDKLIRFYELLVEKNKVMNLTAITEYEEVVTKHFLDSASINFAAEKNERIKNLLISGGRVLDLGTGAGFPGIPLKILFPSLKITLMDSLGKRLIFLDEVIEKLSLTNIKTFHARAEEAAKKPEYREKFDLAVSRAVARLNVLSELCIPFVKAGGHFIPYKAGGSEEEIAEAGKAITVLGGRLINIIGFELPGTDTKRVLPIIRKTENTPAKYPRNGKKLGTFAR